MTRCVNGSWAGGGCCPFNYISINIGGQLVPFSQVRLSSVQLRVVELQTVSLSLLCSCLFQADGGRCCLRWQRRRLQSISTGMSTFPRTFLSPIPIELQRPERREEQAETRYGEKRLPKRVREKRLAALKGSLPSRIHRWCLQSPSD